jgi:hypothetical protein
MFLTHFKQKLSFFGISSQKPSTQPTILTGLDIIFNRSILMLKPAKVFGPNMAQNADFVRVSARLSSVHQYELIETNEMFCFKGPSSKKFITKHVQRFDRENRK